LLDLSHEAAIVVRRPSNQHYTRKCHRQLWQSQRAHVITLVYDVSGCLGCLEPTFFVTVSVIQIWFAVTILYQQKSSISVSGHNSPASQLIRVVEVQGEREVTL
jgi:hypothetical protein